MQHMLWNGWRKHARGGIAMLGASAALGASVLSGCAHPKAPTLAAAMPPTATSAALLPASTPAPAPAPHREMQGQLSIKLKAFGKQAAKGLSLGFFFTGSTDTGRLELITLMGSQLAQVNWTTDEVWLTDDKGRHRYASMEHLSASVLGESLPLQALVHWMQGAPDPAWPSAPGPQPQTFTQLGWTIDQRELASKKLTATREASASQRGVFVKVYLDR